MIQKLPSQWKDFKNFLKHKQKMIKIEDLIVRFRIKEDNKRIEKKGNHSTETPTAKENFVEHGPSSKKRKSNKGNKLGLKGRISKKKFQFKVKCFNCDKMGHKFVDYEYPKRKKDHKDNTVDDISSGL